MLRISILLTLLAAVVFGSGCGLIKKRLFSRKHPPETSSQTEMFIGIVESVNPEQQFVLVRMDMRVAVSPGTKLETRAANGAKGSIVVTPERKMNFLSADISGGFPARGDLVFMLPQPATTAQSATSAVPTSVPVPGVPPSEEPPLPLPVR